MLWEVTYIRVIEADNFFDAVDAVKESDKDIKNVVSVCPFIEDEYI